MLHETINEALLKIELDVSGEPITYGELRKDNVSGQKYFTRVLWSDEANDVLEVEMSEDGSFAIIVNGDVIDNGTVGELFLVGETESMTSLPIIVVD